MWNSRSLYFFGLANLSLCIACLLMACSSGEKKEISEDAQESSYLILDKKFNDLILVDEQVELVADGFSFTEGPAWHPEGYLIFSDIPENKIYAFRDGEVEVYQEKSGQSNGLLFDAEGNLLKCEHRGRRVSMLSPDREEKSLIDSFQGAKLNSPNDLAMHSQGALFFTDPPYGLSKKDQDKDKEIPFNGVFLWKGEQLSLIDSTMTRPNGIALSPQEDYLYVANSGDTDMYWKRFSVDANLNIGEGRLFFDVSDMEAPGKPDGLKLDTKGNLYATGPGGVLVLSPEGDHLGTILIPKVPTNCAWGDDGKTLYITAQSDVYKVRLNAVGNKF